MCITNYHRHFHLQLSNILWYFNLSKKRNILSQITSSEYENTIRFLLLFQKKQLQIQEMQLFNMIVVKNYLLAASLLWASSTAMVARLTISSTLARIWST